MNNHIEHLQCLMLVIDSTDRERLALIKDELYKMLSHEVSKTTYDVVKTIHLLFVHLFFQVFEYECLPIVVLFNFKFP